MIKLYAPNLEDKRIAYAVSYLQKIGYDFVSKIENASFVLLPPKMLKSTKFSNAVDYLNDECFAIENAYLTAESAISIAIQNSEKSLVNSSVLITGYGRISKALLTYLKPFTNDITICARNGEQRILAIMNGAKSVDFDTLKLSNNYDFVFNTVPFPVFNEPELTALKNDALIIDLASFPGGVDKHFASLRDIKLVEALALPGKYSPKTAGEIVARAVDRIIKEGNI